MTVTILQGDVRAVLATLGADSFDCVVTSPPYWRQRDYGMPGQIGLELTPEAYVDSISEAMTACRRVLKSDGSLWLNIGDKWAAGGNGGGGSLMSSSRVEAWAHARDARGWRSPPTGYKDKDLTGIPWLVALRLRQEGWYFRQAIIWDKMVATEPPRRDRPSVSHEYIFLLSKEADSAVRHPGEPWFASSVWQIRPNSNIAGHPACMEPEIARRCIVSGSRPGGAVIDPFAGAGTSGLVADRLGRDATLIELNPAYIEIAKRRIEGDAPLFAEVVA